MDQPIPRQQRLSLASFDRIKAEQARTLYRNCPWGVTSAAVVAVMLALALTGSGAFGASRAFPWSFAVVCCAGAHLALCALYWKAKPSDEAWRFWIVIFTLIAFVEGALWCVGAVVLTSPTDVTEALIVLLAFAGVSAGGVVVFGPYVPTYIAFLYPTMAPHIVFAFLYRYPYWQLMAALESTFVVALPLLAWRYSMPLVTGFRLQFANLDLAEDLRRQKDIAETANRAKSQFLAAVSHDLRQPIHALGLFIGALRGREMDGEAQRLVDFIDRSVEAMDALFNALLDISKLDAGAVQPHFETVPLAPLLKRLCDEYATEAERKGLAIRYRSCSCSVRSDPALLERILRNLITNAVRYTEHGGVLVGCRREAGAVRIEVWDTGCGISPEQTDLIFQEFYQVGNRERDRSKGVGLGLAIVRRTSDVLGATLTFGSRPEHGSVFRLTLEPAADVPAIPTKPSALCAPPIVEALILVVDDDVDIQQAMKGLLTSWGYRVALGGSGDEIIASVEDQLQPPNLIICDYRLRGQETGVDVIRRLHQRYGDAMIPAILITGDTAPDRIVDARASGFALLHKPLSNSRLRAAIGNLLRA